VFQDRSFLDAKEIKTKLVYKRRGPTTKYENVTKLSHDIVNCDAKWWGEKEHFISVCDVDNNKAQLSVLIHYNI